MTDKEKEKIGQDYSRRNFIKTAALTVGATQALSVLGLDTALAASESKNLAPRHGRVQFRPYKGAH